MLIGKRPLVPSSEIVSETVFRSRRRFLQQAGVLGLGVSVGGQAQAGLQPDDEITPEGIVTSYNNFYEFGTGKSDPVENAGALTTDPWSVEVSGAARKTGTYALEDILRGLDVEERIYRFRCVEAWSMVVPWNGIPLKKILEQFEPTGMRNTLSLKLWCAPRKCRASGQCFPALTGRTSRACVWMKPTIHWPSWLPAYSVKICRIRTVRRGA